MRHVILASAVGVGLAADLKKDGITLKPGDLVSLGAFGNLPAVAGQSVRGNHEGLPGNPTLRVRFRSRPGAARTVPPPRPGRAP